MKCLILLFQYQLQVSVMIFPYQTKLSQFIASETTSFQYHSFGVKHTIQQLNILKTELTSINLTYESFKNNTLELVNEWMGKISTFVLKQIKAKNLAECQFQKSQNIQNSMKNQVFQLKEMIQQAVQDYQKQLYEKDKTIHKLVLQLSEVQKIKNHQADIQIKVQQSRKNQRQLEIIQQQSQHATFSSTATLRDIKEQKYDEKSNQCRCTQSKISEVPKQQKQNCQNRPQHKRTKSFIDHFRKTIQQSFSQKKQEQCLIFPISTMLKKQPLREISLNHNQSNLNNGYYTHGFKIQSKDSQQFSFKTLNLNCQSREVSNSSSRSDLILNNQTEKINIPKKFETPNNLMLFKKKDPFCQRVMTQPSHQFQRDQRYFSKPAYSQKKIFCDRKKSHERCYSTEQSKSVKSSVSKEKIKVTAKMIDEFAVPKKNNNSKALVYLGGKGIFRKFLLQLKNAFKKYTINLCKSEDEIKFQGQKKNGMRWGKGKIIYRNGTIYDGEFRQNMRHGRGSILMNGISIYQGLFFNDKLHGQGYIKSMRYMSSSCSPIFVEASYCGNLHQNKLNGIGTVFLNPKEKIVTKFLNGNPIGDLTYYNLHQIEFGVWPSQ